MDPILPTSLATATPPSCATSSSLAFSIVDVRLDVLRARNLPRTLLNVPSPFVELHTLPAAPPLHVSPIADRTTSPEWPSFSHRLVLPTFAPTSTATAPSTATAVTAVSPTTVGLIVRDANNPHLTLAQLTLSVSPGSTFCGWLPLRLDNPAAYHAAVSPEDKEQHPPQELNQSNQQFQQQPQQRPFSFYSPRVSIHPAAEIFVVLIAAPISTPSVPASLSPTALPSSQPLSQAGNAHSSGPRTSISDTAPCADTLAIPTTTRSPSESEIDNANVTSATVNNGAIAHIAPAATPLVTTEPASEAGPHKKSSEPAAEISVTPQRQSSSLKACLQPQLKHFPNAPLQSPRLQNSTEPELRAVNPFTGALFRAGRLRISAVAHGVPTTLRKPFLHISTADQAVRGHELRETSSNSAATSSSSSPSSSTLGTTDASKKSIQSADYIDGPALSSASSSSSTRTSTEIGLAALKAVRSGGKKIVTEPGKTARKSAKTVRDASKVVAQSHKSLRGLPSVRPDSTLQDVASALRGAASSSRWRFGRSNVNEHSRDMTEEDDPHDEVSGEDDSDHQNDREHSPGKVDENEESGSNSTRINLKQDPSLMDDQDPSDRKRLDGLQASTNNPSEDSSLQPKQQQLTEIVESGLDKTDDNNVPVESTIGNNNKNETNTEEKAVIADEDNRKTELDDNLPKSSPNRPSATPDIKSNKRRMVDFGTFELALFSPSTPKFLKVVLQPRASARPAKLGVVTEQKIDLPNLHELVTCPGKHVLHLQASDGGVFESRVTLCLTVVVERWEPRSGCRNVTPRFQELLANMDEEAPTVKSRHQVAEGLTYLFVGGLFTRHYPTYFEKNVAYLQEIVQVARVQAVPIHTEGSLDRNSQLIRDCVVKTCRGQKSVVLIGHSKGGVDVLTFVERYPEVVPFLFGVVTFQAPFGGSYMVDYVSSHSLALSAIEGIITNLWKGDGESFTCIGYTSRLKHMGLEQLLLQEKSDDHHTETAEADNSSPNNLVGNDEAIPDKADGTNGKQEETGAVTTGRNWDALRKVPVVAFGSYASFDILDIRSAANAAGVASMASVAQRSSQNTGFENDGLVSPWDALVPGADVVVLDDMMHTEPALYVQGTKYHPGKLTAAAVVLLLEMEARRIRGDQHRVILAGDDSS